MRFRRGSGREIIRRNRVNQVSPIKSVLRKSLQFGDGGTTECSPVLRMICPVCQGPHSNLARRPEAKIAVGLRRPLLAPESCE